MKLALPAVRFPMLRYLFGAIALYFLFLIVTAPAWLVVWALPKMAPFPITVQENRGSLWRGTFEGVNAALPTGQNYNSTRSNGNCSRGICCVPNSQPQLN